MLRCSCISSVPFHPPNFCLTLLPSTLSSPPFLHMAPAFSLPIPHPHSTPPSLSFSPIPSFLPSLPPSPSSPSSPSSHPPNCCQSLLHLLVASPVSSSLETNLSGLSHSGCRGSGPCHVTSPSAKKPLRCKEEEGGIKRKRKEG